MTIHSITNKKPNIKIPKRKTPISPPEDSKHPERKHQRVDTSSNLHEGEIVHQQKRASVFDRLGPANGSSQSAAEEFQGISDEDDTTVLDQLGPCVNDAGNFSLKRKFEDETRLENGCGEKSTHRFRKRPRGD